MGVILISLLLRVKGDQIKSAFRIYTPLMAVSFLVIVFRIILIPNELVNMLFPPILLICAIWQWSVIGRHNQNIPRHVLQLHLPCSVHRFRHLLLGRLHADGCTGTHLVDHAAYLHPNDYLCSSISEDIWF